MVKLVTIMIPEKKEEGMVEKKLLYLDERIAQTPAIALSQTLKELNRMGTAAYDNLALSLEAFFELNEQKAQKVMAVEDTIDYLSSNITNYMITFRGIELSDSDLKVMGTLHHVIIDMERIGDFAENIAEFSMTLADNKEKLSAAAQSELSLMAEKTKTVLSMSLDAFEKRDKS